MGSAQINKLLNTIDTAHLSAAHEDNTFESRQRGVNSIGLQTSGINL